MNYKAFTDRLNEIRPHSENSSAVWLEWAKELEKCDSCGGEKQDGAYKTSEMFLGEFIERIENIRTKYGNQIAGQIISLADIPACPFPWEMNAAAEHLSSGGRIEDIPGMEEEGTLEEFDVDEEENSTQQGLQM